MNNPTPVLVKFRGHLILALVSKSVTPPGNDHLFALVEEKKNLLHSERFCLVGLKKVEPTFYSIRLFSSQLRLGEKDDNADTQDEHGGAAAEHCRK